MKLLADENIEPPIVEWLRVEGHDVVSVFEQFVGFGDEQILEQALKQQRVLITHDLDFGKLVIRDGLAVAGVILLRLTAAPTVDRLDLLKRQWPAIVSRCLGHFLVVSDHAFKSRPL